MFKNNPTVREILEALQAVRRALVPILESVRNRVEAGVDATEKISLHERAGIAMTMLFLCAVGDIATGVHPAYRHIFYIPIWFGAWFLNRRVAYFLAFLASVWIWFVPSTAGQMYDSRAVISMFIAIATFHFGAWMLSHFRTVYDRERVRARIDWLTGVHNTHGFYEAAAEEFGEMRESFRPFALIYVDLDHFKQLNDTLGHLEADKALKLVGKLLSDHIRRSDIVGRVGGDEFVVLLKAIGPDMAFAAADRLHEYMGRELAKRGWQLSASIGCVAFESLPTNVHRALQVADEVMYAAKGMGRSQVVKSLWDDGLRSRDGAVTPEPAVAAVVR